MLTLNQHIKLFKDFADNHLVIQSFDFGKLPDWGVSNKQDGENLIYPAMFVMPVNSNRDGQLVTTTYTVYFCERERKGANNENDGWSDCQRIWYDFISYMTKSLNDFPIALDAGLRAEPFREWDVDYLVAYVGDFALRESFDNNDCVIPIIGSPSWPDSVVCAPVTIYLDNVLNQVAASGSTVNITSSGGAFTYDLYFDGVDTGQDVTVDGTAITINLN